jgi:curved DNA-binding protein CbpA
MTQDYYEILQVHPKADVEAITAGYHRLRELYDPQRLNGAADELVELARRKRDGIERAYAVLSDPQRRAAYDAELANRPGAKGDAADEDDNAEIVLDYRPLPPARRGERVKGFDTQPKRIVRSSETQSENSRMMMVFAGVLVLTVVLGVVGFSLTGGNAGIALGPPAAVPTPSPFDQFEADIAEAKTFAEQNPNNSEAWISYGNLLYNSAEIVREFQPDSDLYRARLTRWLQASDAYSRALALDPSNTALRADLGVSSCFYGAGTSSQQYVVDGLAQVRQAAERLPNDPRVLLSLGHCLINSDPPRKAEALEAWLKVRESQPAESGFAQQAQILIQQYNTES